MRVAPPNRQRVRRLGCQRLESCHTVLPAIRVVLARRDLQSVHRSSREIRFHLHYAGKVKMPRRGPDVRQCSWRERHLLWARVHLSRVVPAWHLRSSQSSVARARWIRVRFLAWCKSRVSSATHTDLLCAMSIKRVATNGPASLPRQPVDLMSTRLTITHYVDQNHPHSESKLVVRTSVTRTGLGWIREDTSGWLRRPRTRNCPRSSF